MPDALSPALPEQPADAAASALDKPVLQRRVPLQQRGQQTVDQILHASAQVIEREGLDKLTTKRIAVEAGLSVGSVYEYFPNKEAVLSAMVVQWFDQLMRTLDAHHPSSTGCRDILTYLQAVIEAVRQDYIDQPALGAMLSALGAIPTLRELVEQHDERVTANMADALRVMAPTIPLEELRATVRSIALVSHELMSEALVRNPALATRTLTHMKVCIFALVSHLLVSR